MGNRSMAAIISKRNQKRKCNQYGVPSWMFILMNRMIEETGSSDLSDNLAQSLVYFMELTLNPTASNTKKFPP
jgi:hypothetical protein